ncbi:HU family DNA-binding protein [Nocardioides acrostichi]|uniref:HU family DNA-binding protein n=1 Tax=Nocardioides acrostichi TaxID=2784339 RepID=A0A930UZB8_9ACTN|nr:HU family DNA-binding protein [Nocardioides acrostichi]MBF4163663.1 HU family DNA-binding protein [Nocardioides acrostichi]
MNKRELVEAIAKGADIDLTTADKALSALTDAITGALKSGDKVALAGFGTFETRHREARTGRNPQTGESMEIAASTSAAFKPAAALKRELG